MVQRKRIDLANEIRGLLKVFGVTLPMRLSRGAFEVAVRDTIESDSALRNALPAHAACPADAVRNLRGARPAVRNAGREDEVCTRFIGVPGVPGVPGVGEIMALSFKAAIDDPATAVAFAHRLAPTSAMTR